MHFPLHCWFLNEIITNEELLCLVTLLASSGYHDIDKENEKIKKLQHYLHTLIGRLLGLHRSSCIVKLKCACNWNGNAMVALICKIAISSIKIIGTLIWLEISVKASIPLPGLKVFHHHPPPSPAMPPDLGSLMIRAYTATSRKVVGKNVHATIPKGNVRYDQYTVPDTVAVKISFPAFL